MVISVFLFVMLSALAQVLGLPNFKREGRTEALFYGENPLRSVEVQGLFNPLPR
jgi:hypothetical protein